MFLDFYGLREQPFGVTPDPRFLFFTESHREALASLYYGIKTERGFISLIADPGMGKTTLLFELLARLRGNARTAFVFHTQCTSRELVRYVATELGMPETHDDQVQLHRQLHDLLVQEANAGRQVVIVIDEAQNLSSEALEAVRLLSDFETAKAKLIQIVLAGQSQLGDTLAMPAAVQLRQRIALWRSLKPFSRAEVASYIQHRLKLAGHSTGQIFTAEAIDLVSRHSQGIPRTINHLCFSALSTGFALSKKVVDMSIVGEAIADEDLNRGGQPITSAAAGPATQRLAAAVAPDPVVAKATTERRWRISDRRKPWTSRAKSIERRAGKDRRGIGDFSGIEEVQPVAENSEATKPTRAAAADEKQFKNPARYVRAEAQPPAEPKIAAASAGAQYLMSKRPEERIRTKGPVEITNSAIRASKKEPHATEDAPGNNKSMFNWLTKK